MVTTLHIASRSQTFVVADADPAGMVGVISVGVAAVYMGRPDVTTRLLGRRTDVYQCCNALGAQSVLPFQGIAIRAKCY